MQKRITLAITLSLLLVVAGCGGSGGSKKGSTRDKYYTIKYQMPNMTSKSSTVKNIRQAEEDALPEEPNQTEVIPEEVSEDHYYLNDPIPAGVMIHASNKDNVYPYWGAMCQVFEVDPSSNNRVVVENCNWSCTNSSIGTVTNSDNISADFQFSIRGKTNVIATTPNGVQVEIPAHVYPCTMLNWNTLDWGNFSDGFIFDSETGTDTTGSADIFIVSGTGEVKINGGICEVDQPFAQITEAPTDESMYTTGKTFTYSQIPFYTNFIIKTETRYVKFRFASAASGGAEGYSVAIQYMVADEGTNKFQY